MKRRKARAKKEAKHRRRVVAVDLFCGAGGTSKGLARACERLRAKVDLVAINHWPRAIATHTKNHPWARHVCASAETLDPREVVPRGKLDILVASPECVHFSTARGGRPVEDQKRASAWQLLRWLELLQVESLLVENVPEFKTWGPVGRRGRPLKKMKGKTYQAWLAAIQSLGYNVEARVLNAADHGDATSRRRLFVLARRGRRQVTWPQPTHSKDGGNGTEKWRAAREIIDWSLVGKSIFKRKRPLAAATMRRIIAGLEKFGGPELKPFLVILRGTGTVRSVEDPAPSVTAGGNHLGLAEPFILSQASGGAPRPVSEPVPTICAGGAHALVQPFILPPEGIHRGNRPRSPDEPLQTITRRGGGHLVEAEVADAFVMATGGPTGQMQPRGVGEPLRTIIPNNRLNVFRAFIVPQYGEREGQKPRTHSVDAPLPAPTSHGAGALVEPFIIGAGGPARQGDIPRSVDGPLTTVLAENHKALVEPYLVQYNGQSEAHSIEGPLPTITTRDRIGLVQPVVGDKMLDIRFRMLQPHELSAAMGFESDYAFTGTKQEVVRQIGNAVAVHMAEALCTSLLTASDQSVLHAWGKQSVRR